MEERRSSTLFPTTELSCFCRVTPPMPRDLRGQPPNVERPKDVPPPFRGCSLPMSRTGSHTLCRESSLGVRCRANMPYLCQSRPDPGLGFQVAIMKTVSVVPSSLGRKLTNVLPVSKQGFAIFFFFLTLVTGSRRSIRAGLGTTAHLCRVVVFRLRAVPSWFDIRGCPAAPVPSTLHNVNEAW